MKKNLLLILLFAALSSAANESIIHHLLEVNTEWKNQSDAQQHALTCDAVNNTTFDDWIATHLMLVEQTLRQRSTEQLSHQQTANRYALLNELNSYWHSRAFPVNDYLSYKNPVFIDRTGNHCAVGFLMKQSGASALAQEINSKQKFAFIKDITIDGVADWASTNGFTLDELAWIQPGYPVAYTVSSLEGGLNGTVNCMVTSSSNPAIYAGGSFTSSTKGASCNGIAMYISGIAGMDWLGLGTGVNGTVNSILIHNDALYVGGEFTMAGSVPANNIAIFDLLTYQWMSIGSLDAEVTSLAIYNNEIYAGGKFTGYISKWNGSQWQDVSQGFIYGEGVRTLEVWDNLLLIGGKFELATGALRRHVATFDGTQMGSSGFGTVTPVNDFEVFRDTLYAACDFVDGTDTCAIARLVNYDWEIAIKPFQSMMDYFDGISIKQLMAEDNQLFCAGEFAAFSGMIYGSNLMKIDNVLNGQWNLSPLLLTDNRINTIAPLDNTICFGGSFIAAGNDTLNHIGVFSNSLLGIDVPRLNTPDLFEVYPNPASNYFRIHLKEFAAGKDLWLKICDVTGREVWQEKILNPLMPVDIITAKGIYLVQLMENEKLLGVERLIVN